jgi:3-oxoacyl-[acyl-carrier-protein] synthase II
LLFLTACAAGNYAIAYAYELIRMGKVDIAITGGADAFSPEAFAGFNRLFAVAPRKCQPFSKNRKGMIPAEGAGVLILESEQRAKKRRAHIYGEILGYGLSCDAYHPSNLEPEGKGILNAFKDLFNHSGINPEDVDYISAHGTGTIANDRIEAKAINDFFGLRAKKIPVNSVKSMLGHCMGAASVINSVVCALVIKNGIIPPTINYEEFDPECDLDCVPNKSRRQKVNIVLSNSFGFGGNNAILAIGKYYG